MFKSLRRRLGPVLFLLSLLAMLAWTVSGRLSHDVAQPMRNNSLTTCESPENLGSVARATNHGTYDPVGGHCSGAPFDC